MSTHWEDPDRTPPQGIPRFPPPGAGRPAVRHEAADRPLGQVPPTPAAGHPHRVRPVRQRSDETIAHGPDETVYDGGQFTPASTDDGWSVAPAVIGGELPRAAPAPPRAVPAPPRAADAPAEPVKRSFLGKLLRRDG